MKEAGSTYNEIQDSTGAAPATIAKILKEPILPDERLVEVLQKRKVADLEVLHGLVRNNLVAKVVNGKGNIIENVAVMDKTFQQIQVLKGQPTQNINMMHAVADKLKAIDTEAKEWDD